MGVEILLRARWLQGNGVFQTQQDNKSYTRQSVFFKNVAIQNPAKSLPLPASTLVSQWHSSGRPHTESIWSAQIVLDGLNNNKDMKLGELWKCGWIWRELEKWSKYDQNTLYKEPIKRH